MSTCIICLGECEGEKSYNFPTDPQVVARCTCVYSVHIECFEKMCENSYVVKCPMCRKTIMSYSFTYDNCKCDVNGICEKDVLCCITISVIAISLLFLSIYTMS